MLKQPHRLEFGGGAGQSKSDTLGALATPQMSILGLSKTMGPVAGQDPANADDIASKLGNAIGNEFDPADFFKGATILGGIELAKILSAVTGLAGPKVPKLVSRELDAPKRVQASFKWVTEITQSRPEEAAHARRRRADAVRDGQPRHHADRRSEQGRLQGLRPA